jgi:hypothetical protein
MSAEHDVQPAATDASRVSTIVAPASARVRAEWRARIAAEYASATITQELVLWLMVIGAPPDLIDEGLAIVSDELMHSRLSNDVYAAAGGNEPPAIDRSMLGLTRQHDSVELDVLAATVRVFCLGETVAVPLFSHLRDRCTVAPARAALDRIIVDEVRHREFGWDTLDYLAATNIEPLIVPYLRHELPAMFLQLQRNYGMANRAVAADHGSISDDDRAWGLAPPREYAAILDRAFERDYSPRFEARGLATKSLWQAALGIWCQTK